MGADMSRVRTAVLVAALGLGTAGCGDDGNAAERPTPTASASITGVNSAGRPVTRSPGPPEVVARRGSAASPVRSAVQVAATIATGLSAPWGLDFLPDGSAVVSERDSAKIKRIAMDGTVTTLGTVPGVVPGGEGGLLGIAVEPRHDPDTPVLYAYLTAANDNRIVRMELDNGLGKPSVILDGIRKAGIHNGGRMVFGSDGTLYVGTGDAGVTAVAQDPASLNGKILRMTRDGTVPVDNPTRGSLVFSTGHRNVQGLAFDGRGRLWASEFGQNTFDELNLIEAGKNYGWPAVEGRRADPDPKYTNPQRTWATSEASPSGIAVAGGSVWMAALRGARLWEIPLTETGASEPTGTPRAWLNGQFGRLRTVVTSPDGSLWLITSNTDGRGEVRTGDDRILRLSI